MKLKQIRAVLAAIFWIGISLLFLDFSGALHVWLGWMAKLQFLPSILALNIGVILLVTALTLLFGRIYCSVICPLGVYQDIVSRIAGKFKKNRFRFSPERRKLRLIVLGIFVVLLFVFTPLSVIIEPYSAYGKIVTLIFKPVYEFFNNLLASVAEHYDSYAFYQVDVWLKSGIGLAIALVTWIVVTIISWKSGRGYCNSFCPVGTVLGYISKKSVFRIQIDDNKCVSCTLCEKNCKAQAIDSKAHQIDYSRCVSCMNCIEKCHKGAISFSKYVSKPAAESDEKSDEPQDSTRRKLLTTASILAVSGVVKAQEKKFDGGFAVIEKKQIPEREVPVKPAGSISLKNFTSHCVGCQLCVAECPNGVLRPSEKLSTFMQPEMSFELGYCRPECTRCSEVCPAGAIVKITREEKTTIRAGHAVWIKDNCLPAVDGISCGNCAKHCPSGAITMVEYSEFPGVMIPSVNSERCIGCGACEHLCPSRPLSAIYVEGNLVHMDL